MTELSPEARALLDSTRDGDDPSARDRARMRQRLGLAIAAAGAGAAASAAAPAAATTAASASASVAATATKAGLGAQVAAASVQATVASTLTAKISVAVTVAVIGAAGSGVVLNREHVADKSARRPVAAAVEEPRAPLRKRVRVDEPAPVVAAPNAAAPNAAAPNVAAPAPIVEPLPVLAPAPSPRPVVRVERPASKVAPLLQAKAPEPAADAIALSLQTEIQLLSSAQVALRDGAHDRALASLAEHASRFPNGALALERDAVRAIALCSSGRSVVGRSAALALAPRIAGSPLAARLERACELHGDAEQDER